MSKAGIHSNRGDGYQTLIAFDWALEVLANADYEWLEIDSIDWPVDDVVIGRADGRLVCCQCKKNQPSHKAWSIADLADELRKARDLLDREPEAQVRFYSRTPFGDLAALAEHSTLHADETGYRDGFGERLRAIDIRLGYVLGNQSSPISTYQLLRRTVFTATDEIDRLRTALRTRLGQLVSNSEAAFSALWTCLDHLGMRLGHEGANTAVRYRVTKEDLNNTLARAGAMLTPPANVAAIRVAFARASTVGRSWCRDIAQQRIPSPAVAMLLAAIEARHRTILLTGQPGSGKTCVMLSVLDELEERARSHTDLLPLFIQSREFADIVVTQERAAIGLPEQWVENVARLAERAHVVVMIDSLDVLSIAREHKALSYFLAQIERLRSIPGVTVVTACREFDCNYDLRIRQLQWDQKITCPPLDWDTAITPLLATLSVDASSIDATTRALIANPRELALFVELAQREGSFNVVTSQMLAQRYLQVIVQSNLALGDSAMQAIEAMAEDMLKSRSLAIACQRFQAPEPVLRALLSNNVLHEPQPGQLTFGHQTLLDTLIIHRAIRQGSTLHDLLQGLPATPFVRPSIRSFVLQLASGDRKELRKQLRTVLTGQHAFHIRRLVARTFAEQAPHEGDWPLLRDLRRDNRDVFNEIYDHADQLEWHHLWMRHLIPFLKDTQDIDGLTIHVHLISRWKNHDAEGVISFWSEALALSGMNAERINNSIAYSLSTIDENNLPLCADLLKKLLERPVADFSFTGKVLARCVSAGCVGDDILWRYIAGGIGDEDVTHFRFNNKLRCTPAEFDEAREKFLEHRMRDSTELLELAVGAIERWSAIKNPEPNQNIYWSSFLHGSSYAHEPDQHGHRHLSNEEIFINSIEKSVLHQATNNSPWWRENRHRLCLSPESCLRYFAIAACTAAPETNLDIIPLLLTDRALLDSPLSHEVGNLIEAAFFQLDEGHQENVLSALLTLKREYKDQLTDREWVADRQNQLILAVPAYLRSPDLQALLDERRNSAWPLIRQADTNRSSVFVRIKAPFSFETFMALSDDGVLKLLNHYSSYRRNIYESLEEDSGEIGHELREAASRQPTRFEVLMRERWERIPERFRSDIMDGVATYLAYHHGELSAPGNWSPMQEPNAAELAIQMLDELEKHPAHWQQSSAAAKALKNCAHTISGEHDALRLVRLAADFSGLPDESLAERSSIDLLNIGVNMNYGKAAEAVLILANRLSETGMPLVATLPGALRQFARDENPAIRALLLRRLAYFQSHHPDLGWELFDLALQTPSPGLWPHAEPCLYYAYHRSFHHVSPYLARLHHAGEDEGQEAWGRLSALAALSGHVDSAVLIGALKELRSIAAWRGAAGVWAHPGNMRQHLTQCCTGLEAGLHSESLHAVAVAQEFRTLFRWDEAPISLPIDLIRRCLHVLETGSEKNSRDEVFGFNTWINAMSLLDPLYALEATEIYLAYIRQAGVYLFDHDNSLVQLLNRLFMQAEEQEEADDGAMLQRVIAVQDQLLFLKVGSVDEWLGAAERL